VCQNDRECLGRQCTCPSSGHDDGWGNSGRMRVMVLQPAVTGADGGDIRASGWVPTMLVLC
jgi:hypothetical protein